MGAAPLTDALGLLADPVHGFKDTAQSILDTGEFVINLVPERLVHAMNETAVNAPTGVDELDLAGLETDPFDADCTAAYCRKPCRIRLQVVIDD